MSEYTCTVEDHAQDLQQTVALVWPTAKREGYLEGYKAGEVIGYVTGFSEGARSTDVYRIAAADEFSNGYQAALGDVRDGKAVGAHE